MKRLIALVLLVCMITALSACGSEEIRPSSDSESNTGSVTESQLETESETDEIKSDSPEEGDEEHDSDNMSSGSNILVAFFPAPAQQSRSQDGSLMKQEQIFMKSSRRHHIQRMIWIIMIPPAAPIRNRRIRPHGLQFPAAWRTSSSTM